jgi:BirA family biotin operon repressor/biotin-[acetyl-CoA-carboxylase] ligase
MDIKEQVLATLESDRGAWHSGESMAERAGVSRAAIWKAVKALQEDGYQIESGKNRGYRLSAGDDMLSKVGIEKHLGSAASGLVLQVFDEVTSTNDLIRQMAERGAEEGHVIVAGTQTAGRGRFGRPFFSPRDTGLYLSMLLRPNIRADESWLITSAAAVAVVEAIEQVTGRETGIKWVNDVYLGGRKVCGILTEASLSMEAGTLDYAVPGIGINVYMPVGGFPAEIADKAGVVSDTREAELRNRLAAGVLTAFMRYYRHLSDRSFVESYRAHSIVVGRDVEVVRGGKRLGAHALGVDDDLRLHVRFVDGSEEYLQSGEVSIRISDDG